MDGLDTAALGRQVAIKLLTSRADDLADAQRFAEQLLSRLAASG